MDSTPSPFHQRDNTKLVTKPQRGRIHHLPRNQSSRPDQERSECSRAILVRRGGLQNLLHCHYVERLRSVVDVRCERDLQQPQAMRTWIDGLRLEQHRRNCATSKRELSQIQRIHPHRHDQAIHERVHRSAARFIQTYHQRYSKDCLSGLQQPRSRMLLWAMPSRFQSAH